MALRPNFPGITARFSIEMIGNSDLVIRQSAKKKQVESARDTMTSEDDF